MSKMPTDVALNALEMALWVRDRAGEDVTGVVQHSDAGSQYTALRYTERLAEVGAIASIGTVGDSYDNALADSVAGLCKTESVKIDGPFRNADDLELATLSWCTGSTRTDCTPRSDTSHPSRRRSHPREGDRVLP